jgi:hypothetical protein
MGMEDDLVYNPAYRHFDNSGILHYLFIALIFMQLPLWKLYLHIKDIF